MNDAFDKAQKRSLRRMEMEEILRSYPKIEPGALDSLLAWFNNEASAMDVAMLSSADELKHAYSAFRRDYLDRGAKSEPLIWTLLGITVVAAMLGVGAYLT